MAKRGEGLGKTSKAAHFAWRIAKGLLRGIKWLAWTLFVLMAVVLSTLAVIQLTPGGRAWVLSTALTQTNAIIPGTISADRLESLSLLGIEIDGIVILDPQGTRVATVGHLAVETDLPGLFSGTIALTKAELKDAWADLRVLEERKGLIAAFVDPDAPESPSSGGPPPDVSVSEIDVSRVVVLLDLQKVGSVEARLRRLAGSFTLQDGNIGTDLEELLLDVQREDDTLLSVTASGQVTPRNGQTSLELQASSGPIRLAWVASGVLPTSPNFERSAFSMELDLRGVQAERIAEVLREPELKSAFLGELALSLEAQGTPKAPTVRGALTTAGGTLSFDELSLRGQRVRLEMATESLELGKVRSDLPEEPVALEALVETSGFPPDPVEAKLEIREFTFDDRPLVDLDLSGRYTGEVVENIELLATSDQSRLSITGSVQLSGGAELEVQADLKQDLVERLGALAGQDVVAGVATNAKVHVEPTGSIVADGTLSVSNLTYGASGATPDEKAAPVKVKALKSRFFVQDKPPALRGRLSATLEGAALGERHVDEAELEIEGSLAEVDLTLEARGGYGAPDEDGRRPEEDSAAVQLNAHVQRQTTRTRITASGSGRVQARNVLFSIDETTVSDEGRIASEGVSLEVGGQKIHVEGAIAPQGDSAGLDIRFGPVDLAELKELLGVEQNLVGIIDGTARLDGSIAVPVLSFDIAGKDLGLRNKPLAQLGLEGALDANAGRAQLDLRISGKDFSGKKGLSLALEGGVSFEPGQRYASTLLEGDIQLSLQLDKLESEFVKPYLPMGALPLDLGMESQIDLSGPLQDLRLDAKTQAAIRVAGEKPTVVSHELDYHEGRLQSALRVSDGHGRFLSSEAELTLPGDPPSASQMGAAFARAAPEGTWKVHIEGARRALRDLTVLSLATNPEDLPPVAFSFTLDAAHQPNEEPTIDFEGQVTQVGDLGEACDERRLALHIVGSHQGEENRVQIEAKAMADELLSVVAELPLALAPVLEGNDPKLGALSVEAHTKQLRLSRVPLLCDRARGTLELELFAEDILGKKPRLELDGKARAFSLGSRAQMDVDLLAEITHDLLSAEVNLQGRDKNADARGHLAVKVPWQFADGKVEFSEDSPLDARLELHHLPLSPLVPPKGPISYVRGSIDADIRAEGKLNSPLLYGDILLSDVAFTSTSIAQPLRGIEGHLAMEGRKLSIEHLEAHDRDGELRLKGQIDVSDMKEVKGRVEIEADKFPLRQRGQVVAVTDLSAVAQTTVTEKRTDARLILRNVDTWLESVEVRTGIDLEAHPEFVIDGKPKPDSKIAEAMGPQKEKKKQDERGLEVEDEQGQLVHITIDADQRFWIKRKDFAVKLSTLLETEIIGEEVRVNGDVVIDRGYLQLFGKVFDLTRESRLRFIGSNPPNPVLELEAEHKTRGGSVVSVEITGRGDEPILRFFIDGNEVEAGVAVQELFGGQKSGGDSDASNQAASFVSGLTAGVLATAARRELGAAAPILMIDPADKAGEGRVRAGFELDDIVPEFLKPVITGVYLEGIVARESEGEAAANTQFGALLEFYFPKNFFTAGQYGPGTTWSIDLGWQL